MATESRFGRSLLLLTAVSLLAFVAPTSAKSWQTGKVLNAGPAAVVTGPDAANERATTVVFIPNNRAWDAFVLQAGGQVYFCRERRSPNKQAADVSIGEQVAFYLRANLLVFKDKAGKQHKAFAVDSDGD